MCSSENDLKVVKPAAQSHQTENDFDSQSCWVFLSCVPKSLAETEVELCGQYAVEGVSMRRLPSAAESGEEAAQVSHPRTPHGHSAEKVHGHGHDHVGKHRQVSGTTVSMGKAGNGESGGRRMGELGFCRVSCLWVIEAVIIG